MHSNALLFPDICDINTGYISSPATMDTIKDLTDFDEWVLRRDDSDWDEYSVRNCIYPEFLTKLVQLGIAFLWEYEFTEDFMYVAYNFPTEDKPENYGSFHTKERGKKLPRMTKKFLKQVETTSAANELLFTMGIKNG